MSSLELASNVIDPAGGRHSSPHDEWEWLLGILLCLGGAAGTNLGLTVQKLSFMRNDACDRRHQRAAMRQPLWLLGLAIFLCGQTMNLVAFGYTSQALAATLGSFSLVTNGVFAPLILGEKLTYTIATSIAVIVAGSILVVLSSSHASQEYTLAELVALYQRELFIGYMSCLGVAFAVCMLLMWREKRQLRAAKARLAGWVAALEAKQHEFDPTVPSGAADDGLQADPEMAGRGVTVDATTTNGAGGREYEPLIGSHRTSPPPEYRVPAPSSVTPIVAGAILSGCSVLFGKCTVQLVKSSLEFENEFTHPLSWLITLVFLACALGAVGYLNLGLHRGTALFVVPLYYVLNTILAILGGLVYFEEFSRFTPLQAALFATGVATTVAGVWVGSRGQVAEESGEEEGIEVVEVVEVVEERATDESVSPTTTTIGIDIAAGAAPEPTSPAIPPVRVPRAGALRSSERRRSGARSVHFEEEAPIIAWPSALSRLTRAASASDVGLTDEEFARVLAESDRTVGAGATVNSSSPSSSFSSLGRSSALSTPQPLSKREYGSFDATGVSANGPVHPASARSAPRHLDLSHLTPAQQSVVRARHAQLAAAARRYSYNQEAYQASFPQTQQPEGDEPKPTSERRYSGQAQSEQCTRMRRTTLNPALQIGPSTHRLALR